MDLYVRWYEWLVAQEIWRRQAISGMLVPEALKFWTDGQNEVDFVLDSDTWLEVKSGQASPHEFSFLQDLPPRVKLWVISANKLNTRNVQSLTIQEFLREENLDWAKGLY